MADPKHPQGTVPQPQAAAEDVSAQAVVIDEVVPLPPALVKSVYESNVNTNAFTDAASQKLANIEANATADQTATEIRDLLQTLTTTNRLDASAIKNLPTGGGGGGASVGYDDLTSGGATVAISRVGADTASTFSGDGANGYDISAGAHVTEIDFEGDSSTSNASGELVIRFNNSAQGRPRKFVLQIVDKGSNQDADKEIRGHILQEVIVGNVTTLTIPNISGNYPNGFTAKLR